MRTPLPLIATLLLAASLAAAEDYSRSDRRVTITVPGGDDAARDFILAYDVQNQPLAEAARNVPALRDRAAALKHAGQIESVAIRPGTGLLAFDLRVSLSSSDLPAGQQTAVATPQLADAMVELLRARIDPAWQQALTRRKEQAARYAEQLPTLREQLDKARAAARQAESELQASTGRIDLSPDGLRAAKDALELERQRTELDLAGLQARRAAIEEALDQQAARAKAAQANDATAQVLKRALQAAQQRLQQIKQMHENGSASTSEIAQAELAVMEAEARLVERQATGGGTAEAMSQWNRELAATTVDQREKEARLLAATKRLSSLVEAADAGQKLAGLQAQAKSLEAKVKQTEQRHQSELQWLEQHRDARPTLEVTTTRN